jgi:glycosyltransferase involved in cell wall biosynthesis
VRVLLDTTFARRGPSGTAIYVEQLASALREAGVEVVEAANERRREAGTGSARNLAEDVRWTQVDLRRRAREVNADLIHHPLPAHVAGGGVPQVVTVHDLAFELLPDAFDARFAAYARRAHRLAAKRADAVVAVSEATARDLRERWGVEAVVARHGPGQPLDVGTRGEPRHFLYVGDAEPRKDVPTLLAAHARYRSRTADPLPLVLAGSAYAVDSGVRVVDRPSREELAALHRDAAALVHPSRHEGFGLTVLEALAAGTPVIAADTPAIREVAGDAARLVPAGDVDALAAALADPPPPAPAHAPWTWADSAQAHISAYRLALRS